MKYNYIIMSITGPEGVNLDGITAGEFDLQSTNLKIDGYSGGLANIDDKDGLDNCCPCLRMVKYR